MLALRTSTSLSAFGLLIGIAGTTWLTALTYERAPATRRLAEVSLPGTAPALLAKTIADHPLGGHAAPVPRPAPEATPVERLRTRAVVDLAARPVVRRPAVAQQQAAPAPNTQPLVPVYMPSPRYPMEALRAHREGQVILSVTVTPEGDVTNVAVGHTSGDALLDQAAEEAVRSWRFAAAERPAQYTADLPVRFELTDPL
ncbi:energy transducer TonB [Luteibacter yeojuensis]|uniref:energy transducer TonB n=1 Tax=Luteibacter yeojuensis TaxID=345309 RepID=UPI000695F29A|nr:energy transducer TonB [Luteibacter yeojuensis]